MASRRHPNDDQRPGKSKSGGITARLQYGKAADPAVRADWGTVSPVALQALIAAVTETGAAVLLGYSRDRGAYRVLLMDDDGKMPVWIPCTTDVDQAIEDLANEVWTASKDAG